MRTATLLLAHRRHQLLKLIDRQRLQADPTGMLLIALDRPSADVLRVVDEIQRQSFQVIVKEVPFPVLGPTERFNEARDLQVDWCRDYQPDYYLIWDDDHVLGNPRWLRKRLDLKPDIVYARKQFFWNEIGQVNEKFPAHRSSFAFKMKPDETFPPLQMDEHRRPADTKVVDLPCPLLDVGYLTEADRKRCWEAYKRVGKIDAATTPLIDTPRLAPWQPRSRAEVHQARLLHRALNA